MSTMRVNFNLYGNTRFSIIQWTVFSFFIPLFLLTAPVTSQAQQNISHIAAYSQADVENLYRQCKEVREDTAGRICISFLDQHHIRKDNVPAFYAFCADFISYCKRKGNKALSRRMAIIELYGHLRFDSATARQASTAFENLHESYIINKDYEAALECLLGLGDYLHSLNENIKALQVLFYGEKFALKRNLQNKISFHGILDRIGYKLWQLNKPQQSNTYFKRALASGNGLNRDSLIELNGIGINYQKLDSLKQSLYYFAEARRIAIADKNEVFNTVVLGGTAAALLKMGELNMAYDYSMQYKNLSIQYPLWENAVDAFCNLIQIELKRNNTSHAKILLDSLDGIMSKISSTDFVSLKRHKEAEWLYYEKLKQFEKALSAHKEYVYYDSLFQDYANKSRISELELNAAVRLYDQEMAEKERARKLRNLLEKGIVAVAILTMIFLALWGYKKIKKAQNQKAEMETINQQQAAEIEVLKQQLLNQLAAIRTLNASYVELAAEISAKVTSSEVNDTQIQEKAEAENDNEVNGRSSHLQLLKVFDLTKKEQWQTFKDSFSKTYPDFVQSVIAKTGSVSVAELRLLMLLKLGLNNRQIAETLLITMDGVKKAKYRLYKKIGISSPEELGDFLG
jgi:DNA-binding NarL/FixJ family response regulator